MIKYLIAKALQKVYLPSLRRCKRAKHTYIGPGCNLIDCNIDANSYIGKCNSLNNVDIGKFTSIASYCSIGGDSHPTDYVSTSIVFYNKKNVLRQKKFSFNRNEHIHPKVIIGNDVWIGEKVFIKEGILIGDGAIIGAHSVVTHDVEPYSIVAGVPAREIKKRFTEKQIEELLSIKWWNFDEQKIEKFSPYFSDVNLFLEKYKNE